MRKSWYNLKKKITNSDTVKVNEKICDKILLKYSSNDCKPREKISEEKNINEKYFLSLSLNS